MVFQVKARVKRDLCGNPQGCDTWFLRCSAAGEGRQDGRARGVDRAVFCLWVGSYNTLSYKDLCVLFKIFVNS